MLLHTKKTKLNLNSKFFSQEAILEILRKIKFRQNQIKTNLLKKKPNGLPCDYTGQAASDFIRKKLSENQPCMVARFGTLELETIAAYSIMAKTANRSFLWKSTQYLLGNIPMFVIDDRLREMIKNNAGFYPNTDEYIEAFVHRMIEDMKNVDIFGSRARLGLEESAVIKFLPQPTIIPIGDLSPHYHVNPWSQILEEKTVLVIHPFTQTITEQYKKRKLLFKNAEVLPEFELKTFKAVQSMGGGNDTEFKTWFDALDWMCEQINKIEFDIAIIGAGAYGFLFGFICQKDGKKISSSWRRNSSAIRHQR